MKRLLAGLCLVVASYTNVSMATSETLKKEGHLEHLRNTRYCEIMSVKRDLLKFNINVYSTVDLDDCPANLWKKLDKNQIKKQLHADMIEFNGPRYWTIDGLTAKGNSINTPLTIIGGIKFKQRANLDSYIWKGLNGNKFYKVNVVHRNTVWIYNAYTRIYELVDPKGNLYVMQSYAQIKDPNLQMSDLINLGQRLKLPKGWKYQTRVLTKPLELKANGVAYVLRDSLYNTYSREE